MVSPAKRLQRMAIRLWLAGLTIQNTYYGNGRKNIEETLYNITDAHKTTLHNAAREAHTYAGRGTK